ncbi:hypothetical protein [Aquibacillus albus]|uniref:Transposase YdaD n=1 Tax=Aquibacillus albus TaxID=1168171 RepID=A0ABS2MZW2_9BACI|nr:hypothetical protein [Aquibacillus albus]MBM7571407.1 putative transposase YdaD [Aquibacillus albus]
MVYMDRENLPKSLAEWEKIFKDEGREEGKAENDRAVARRMLNDGMSLELVAKYVTLSRKPPYAVQSKRVVPIKNKL